MCVLSGKGKIRTLHKLGLCYALSEVGSLRLRRTDALVTAYDTVCKLCARKDILNADISGESVTSSSTEEEGRGGKRHAIPRHRHTDKVAVNGG